MIRSGSDPPWSTSTATAARRWFIDCPWAHEHSTKSPSSTVVFAYPSGAWEFVCLHSHCKDVRDHDDFRRYHDPTFVPFVERPRVSTRTPPESAETVDRIDAETDPLDGDDAPPHGDEDAPPNGRGGQTKSMATALVALSLQDSELWHSTAGEAFVTVDVGTHREHLRIGSSSHRQWMARLAWRAMDRAVGDSPIKAACAALAGIAVHDCVAHPVHIRIAGGDTGKVWIDLVDDEWRAVEIDANGWRVVNNPPVRFARRNAMSALPVPVANGSLDELREHVRVSEDSWALVAGWLVGALSPVGPYPPVERGLRSHHSQRRRAPARIASAVRVRESFAATSTTRA